MTRRLALLLSGLGCAAVATLACDKPVFDLGGAASQTPTQPTATAPPSSPAPILAPLGDGRDGPLSVTSPFSLSLCFPLASGAGDTLLVPAPAAPAYGDALLVMQVQDDVVSASDTLASPIAATGSAGNWEITATWAVTPGMPTSILVAPPLTHAYVSSGTGRRAQVCRIPQFTSVTIKPGAVLSADPWDGARGGVLALWSSAGIDVSGTLDMSGGGFRGGLASGDGGICGETKLDDPTGVGGTAGGKGEGVDGDTLLHRGRGRQLNGAGGGDAQYSGGGGGGNGGRGGGGGLQHEMCPATGMGSQFGVGGGALTSTTRLFLGGGGGGGDGGDPVAFAGGPGGGVILLRGAQLLGSGVIASAGFPGLPNPPLATQGRGSGGGGAGGTIWFDQTLGPSLFGGSIDVTGGAGGSNAVTSGYRHGPGGGGGGGRFFAPGFPPALVKKNGGVAGQSGASTYGAAGGATGIGP